MLHTLPETLDAQRTSAMATGFLVGMLATTAACAAPVVRVDPVGTNTLVFRDYNGTSDTNVSYSPPPSPAQSVARGTSAWTYGADEFPRVRNPSFETQAHPWPGRGDITAWPSPANRGINPATTGDPTPFANNGLNPEGDLIPFPLCSTLPCMDYIERARDVIDTEIAGLTKARNLIDGGFKDAVEAILTCLKRRGKIVVTGIGKNLHIADKISATLASTGSTSVVLNPVQAMHGDLGILSDGDVLLALSYSGESDELVALIPIMKRRGITSIVFTGAMDSTLAEHSDIVVPVTVEKEACPFGMAPTASTTATLAVGDALAMVLLDARGFKKEDYAKLHPGGAIGRALLLRVADIVRPAERVARVPASAVVKDALLAMTAAGSGSAAVVDDDDRLLGIFTDGDLRRHVANNVDILTASITDVMTPSPITVTTAQLAVDVLRIFEEHNIDDLPVVDADGRFGGASDIQDLPKLKIM